MQGADARPITSAPCGNFSAATSKGRLIEMAQTTYVVILANVWTALHFAVLNLAS
jgi:hypothetical protein